MPLYVRVGDIPPKRHTQFRRPNGVLLYEELMSFHGFTDSYSLLYHVAPPNDVAAIERATTQLLTEWPQETIRHRLFDTQRILASGDIVESRRPLFFNSTITISVASPDRAGHAMYRNGRADELYCIGKGTGELRTPFGILAYGPGDMIVVPRGTIQDWHPTQSQHQILILESARTIKPCTRYLVGGGQFAEHSPVCERDIRIPTLADPIRAEGNVALRVKAGDRMSIYHLAHHPFDVVGWDGGVYPYAINIRDFEPVSRRIHTMPDEQQLFETGSTAICCLVPRILDYHPLSIPAAPYHSSVDIDEVIFNMGEKFMGWTRPSMGVTTFHPRGIPHGPKPGLYEGTIGMKEFDGTAIMIDSADPLQISNYARDCDDPSYAMAFRSIPSKVPA